MKPLKDDLMGADVVHCLYNNEIMKNPTFGLIQLVSRGTPRRVSTYVNDIEAFAKEFEAKTGYKVSWEYGPALYFYYLSFEKGEDYNYPITLSAPKGYLTIQQ